MANTDSTSAAAVIEKRVSQMLTLTLIQESVALPTVRDFTSMVGEGMDRLDIPLFNELAAQAVSESAALTPAAINPSTAQLALTRQYSVPWSITLRAGAQSKVALVPEALRNAARTLAAEIDDHVFSLIDANASLAAPDHRIALSANPLEDIADAKKLLDDQNVPRSERFIAASPGFVNSLLKDSTVQQADAYGSRDALVNGFVTRIHGFDIVESSSASIVDDGFQAYHKGAFAFARQMMPTLRREEKVLEHRDDWSLSHLYGAIATDSSGVRSVVFDSDGA